MATIYSLVCENGSAGTYWSGLTAAEKLRYGAVGSERVYDGLATWNAARKGASDTSTQTIEVCEIGDAFTENQTATLDLSFDKALCIITTMVNGIRSRGFHNGVIGAGYILNRTLSADGTVLKIPMLSIIDGFTVKISVTGYNPSAVSFGIQSVARKIIAIGNSNTYYGFIVNESVAIAEYCLAVGFSNGAGFSVSYSSNAQIIRNCMSAKNKYGFFVTGTSFHGFFYNNIAIGNTTANWNNTATFSGGASNNAGESDGLGGFVGGTPWAQSGAPTFALTIADFNDFGSATLSDTDNFSPSSSTSGQVGNGVDYYQMLLSDLADNPVPSYNPSGEENVDIGPFEYDHGNGLAPQQVTLSISGMAEGSVLAIYKTSDGSAIVNPTTIGASGSYSTTYSYTGDTQVDVVVRKGTSGTKYLPYKAPGLITDTGFALIVNQVEDTVLNG